MAHDHNTPETEKKSVTALRSSFWFTVILVGLFIAALNFVNVMSSGHEEEGHGAHADANSGVHAPTQPTMEATTRESLPGETGIGRPQADTTQYLESNTTRDTGNHRGAQ